MVSFLSKISLSEFKAQYKSWCRKNHYQYSETKAAEIHAYSRTLISSLPRTNSAVKIVTESAKLLNSTLETLNTLRVEMYNLSSPLPEYKIVMNLYGVGKVFCSQLIAEIGDVRQFKSSKSIVALAGIDPPPNQSGKPNILISAIIYVLITAIYFVAMFMLIGYEVKL